MILFECKNIAVWFERVLRINRFVFIALIIMSLNVAGCVSIKPDNAYHLAVVDAAFPDKEEISSNLIPIIKGNQQLRWNADGNKILVCTWKSLSSYEKFLKPYNKTSDNPDYVIWVTTVPQVKNMCAAMFDTDPKISKEFVELRLKQYLGLNPDWDYDVFVEMWVDPADLFRPCVDPQIDDNSCNLNFGDEIPKVKNIADYREFYENLYYKSFRSSNGVPWTGLGYTYDWGDPKSEVGASEYILVPGASYEIKQVVPTIKYCKE